MRLPIFLSRSRRHHLLVTVCLAATVLGAACGIGIRRDLSTIPPGQVGFDDMCGLQDYFDTIEAKLATDWSDVDVLAAHKLARDGLKALLERWEALFEAQAERT